MIEFKGNVSEECKVYLQKYFCKGASLSCGISTLSMAIILATIGRMWDWIIMLFILVPIIMTVFASIPSLAVPLKVLNLYLPKEIVLYDDYIEMFAEKRASIRYYSDVKKVVDCGNWYHIIFSFPNKDSYFVCQKSLITQGSIEEFETLFAEKIVKK
jgi:hypothetical protein